MVIYLTVLYCDKWSYSLLNVLCVDRQRFSLWSSIQVCCAVTGGAPVSPHLSNCIVFGQVEIQAMVIFLNVFLL